MAVSTPPKTAVVRTVDNTDVPALIANDELAAMIIMPFIGQGVSLQTIAGYTRLALAKDNSGALRKCTVASVLLAVAQICAWRLEIGVTAFLVPFNVKVTDPDGRERWESQATPIRGYTGDIQLVIESGMVKRVKANVVYANEPFKRSEGTNPRIEHDIIADPAARGDMVGTYCLAWDRHGDYYAEYMTVAEVDAIRQKFSKQWKDGPVPVWYMKKTVIKQTLKPIPKTPRMREAFAALDAFHADPRVQSLDHALRVADIPLLAPGESMAPQQIEPPVTPLAAPAIDDPYENAPTGNATEDQITRILELTDHAAIDAELREKTKAVLRNPAKPMKAVRASEVIAGLEARIAAATPKPAPAVPADDDDLPF